VTVKIQWFACIFQISTKCWEQSLSPYAVLYLLTDVILKTTFLQPHIVTILQHVIMKYCVTFWLPEYIIIHFLDITRHAVLIQNKVSGSGLYLWPQVKSLFSLAQSIELVPISRDSHAVIIQAACIDFT
jgi:hypothetical protein